MHMARNFAKHAKKKQARNRNYVEKKGSKKEPPKLHYAFRGLRVFLTFLDFLMRFLPAIIDSPQACQLRN
jgi:hypothetical protein